MEKSTKHKRIIIWGFFSIVLMLICAFFVAGEAKLNDIFFMQNNVVYAESMSSDNTLSKNWKTWLPNKTSYMLYANRIRTISFKMGSSKPSGYSEEINVSESSTGNIYLSYKQWSYNSYDVIIRSSSTIYFPQSSHLLFGEVSTSGTSSLVNLENIYFNGAVNTSAVTDMSYMFSYCKKLRNIDLIGLDTANVTRIDYMFYGCESLQNINGLNFSSNKLTRTDYAFYNCQKLTNITTLNIKTTNVTDMSYMFYGCYELNHLDLYSFSFTNVTSTKYMFAYCKRLSNISFPSSTFVGQKITDMSYMFAGCENLYSVNLSFLRTYALTNMASMFRDCYRLQSVNLSTFSTSLVTDMSYMFFSCWDLASLNVSHFVTTKVENITGAFADCQSLKSLNLSNFNLSNLAETSCYLINPQYTTTLIAPYNIPGDVTFIFYDEFTDKYAMYDTYAGTYVHQLNAYNTSKSSSDQRKFQTHIIDFVYKDKGGAEFSSKYKPTMIHTVGADTTLQDAYRENYKFLGWHKQADCLDSVVTQIGAYDYPETTTQITLYADWQMLGNTLPINWFSKLSSIITQPNLLSSLTFETATTIPDGYSSQVEITTGIYASYKDTDDGKKDIIIWSEQAIFTPTNSSSLFSAPSNATSNYYSNLQQIVFNNIDTSNATTMEGMFANLSALTTIKLSEFDTRNSTSMANMFSGCSAIKTLNLSSFNTAKVTDMSAMFNGCSALTSLTISGLSTTNVTNMSNMFNGCSGLTSIYLSSFNTAKVTDMTGMFYGCSGLTTLNLGGFNLKSITITELSLFDESFSATLTAPYNLAEGKKILLPKPMCSTSTKEVVQSLDSTNISTNSYTTKVYKAKFNNIEFKDKNGKDFTGSCKQYGHIYGSSITLPTPTRDGYNFIGWHKQADCLDTAITSISGTAYASDYGTITLYAEWEADGYTLPNNWFDMISQITTDKALVGSIAFEEATAIPTGYSLQIEIATGIYASYKDMSDGLKDIVIWADKFILAPQNSSSLFSDTAIANSDRIYFSNLQQILFNNFNTSNVTNMNNMFNECSNLTTLDISGFDTSQVTSMSSMFWQCEALTTLDISGFDTSKVTDMHSMFGGCKNLTTLNVSEFDTNQVSDMGNMFSYCETLTTLDVSGFDTSQVTDMSSMFYNCVNLTELDVRGFDTSKVTDMNDMFRCCSKLTTLDVSGFNTSQVTDMSGMFWECKTLTTLDVSGFDTSQVTNMSWMFYYCIKLTSLDVSRFDTSKVTNMRDLFNICQNLTSLDVRGFDTSKVTNMSGMFDGCTKLTTLDVSGFDTSKVTNMSCMFDGCAKLTTLDVSGFDTSQVTDMSGMFYNCQNLISLDVNGFDTSKVTNMNAMFFICSNLTALDVSGFNTSKVTDMSYMFAGCTKLTTLDVGNFDTSNVTNMTSMFSNISKLTVLDLSNFNLQSISKDFDFGLFTKFNTVNVNIVAPYNLPAGIKITFEQSICNLSTNQITDYFDSTNISTSPTNTVTYTSNFNAIEYKDKDDQDFSGSCDMLGHIYGQETILPTPTKEGYNFVGWHKQSDCADAVITTIGATEYAEGYGTITLYAEWEEIPHILPNDWFDKISEIATDKSSVGAITFAESSTTPAGYSLQIEIATGIYASYKDISDGLKDIVIWSQKTIFAPEDSSMLFKNFDKMTELNIALLNTSYVTNMSNMFGNDESLTELDLTSLDTSKVIDMSRMFNGCHQLIKLDLSNFDTSQVTDMNNMFISCSGLVDLNLTGFDTANVTNMSSMFWACLKLTEIDLSMFDTSKVTNMDNMFYLCSDLIILDVSNFNLQSVTSSEFDLIYYGTDLETFVAPYNLPEGCKITIQDDMCNIDTREVVTYLDATNTSTSATNKVTFTTKFYDIVFKDKDNQDFSGICEPAVHIYGFETTLPIPTKDDYKFVGWHQMANFADDVVTTIGATEYSKARGSFTIYAEWEIDGYVLPDYWFYQISSITTNASKVGKISFEKSTSIPTGYTSQVLVEDGIYASYKNMVGGLKDIVFWADKIILAPELSVSLFSSYTGEESDYYINLQQITFNNFNTSKAVLFDNMFTRCSSLTTLDVSSFDTSNITSMWGMFGDCSSLTSLILGDFDTSNVKEMSYLFAGCSSLTEIDVSTLETSNIEDMTYMFAGCSGLTTLNVSNFDTANVAFMMGMFLDCAQLTNIDLSTFDTKNVIDMSYMFAGCLKLTNINFGLFDTSMVQTMSYMFAGCESMKNLDLSHFNTTNVLDMSFMFENCISLETINLTSFNTKLVETVEGMFSGCDSLTELDLGNFDLKSCLVFDDMLTMEQLLKIVAPYTSGDSIIEIVLPTNLSYYLADNQNFGKVEKLTNDSTYSETTLSTETTKKEYIAYAVLTFYSDDGAQVLATSFVQYGGDATYPYGTPTKEATAEFTYTFDKWVTEVGGQIEADLNNLTSNRNVYATFVATKNKYTIKFVNWNDSELQVELLEYGTTPVFKGETPTRPASAQYSYTFKGWTPSITYVTGEATYRATYDEITTQYTITFFSEDGQEVLGTATVNYGEDAEFNGEIPTKEATAEFTYVFAKWVTLVGGNVEDNLTNVTENRNVYASFTATKNKYTIKFVNWDNSELQTEELEYGTMPEYRGITPTKEATAEDSYEFVGWNPGVTTVTGDATYTAQFMSTKNQYKVTFYSEDGSQILGVVAVNYGETAVYQNEQPTKESTAEYSYTFDKWVTQAGGNIEADLTNVTENRDVYASFYATKNKYTIKFVNWDNSELQVEDLEYGDTPVFKGATPTRTATAQFTYTFKNWSPAIETVTENATYRATFDEIINQYTITFYSADGSQILGTSTVNFGDNASYEGALPTKEATPEFTYTFDKWVTQIGGNIEDDLLNVTADRKVYASFSATKNKYTIKFVNEDGSELQVEDLEYGTMPEYKGETPLKASTLEDTFVFVGWSPEVTTVIGNATYTAQFSSSKNQYTITFYDEDGVQVLGTATVNYGETAIYPNELPTKTATDAYSYTFAKWVTQVGGEIEDDLSNVIADRKVYASFTATKNKYTIMFVNWDNSELQTEELEYGTMPEYRGEIPTKDGGPSQTFVFAGWDPNIALVSKNQTYMAQFTANINQYTVTFYSEDGSQILGTSTVNFGDTAIYEGALPTKEATIESVFVFDKWVTQIGGDVEDNLSNVIADRNVYASFVAVRHKYTIKFVNDDGSELQVEELEYGAMPEYKGETPTKQPSENSVYIFTTWSKEIEIVTKDEVYVAQYESVDRHYTITITYTLQSEILNQETYIVEYGEKFELDISHDEYIIKLIEVGSEVYEITEVLVVEEITSDLEININYGQQVKIPVVLILVIGGITLLLVGAIVMARVIIKRKNKLNEERLLEDIPELNEENDNASNVEQPIMQETAKTENKISNLTQADILKMLMQVKDKGANTNNNAQSTMSQSNNDVSLKNTQASTTVKPAQPTAVKPAQPTAVKPAQPTAVKPAQPGKNNNNKN